MNTREKILQAGKELFLKKGFLRATVDEIMAQAGLGKGTMYLYFQSKEKLFLSIIEDAWNKLQGKIDNILSKDTLSTELRMKEGFIQYLAFFEEDPSIIALIIDAERNLRSLIATDYFSRYYARLPNVLELFSTTQSQGRVRRNLDAKSTIDLILSFANGLVYMWFIQGCGYSLVERGKQAWEILWLGIAVE